MLLQNLRALRLKKGWDQAVLAKHSGVTQCTISRYELGKTSRIDLEMVCRLCVALECTLKQLVGHNEFAKNGVFTDRFKLVKTCVGSNSVDELSKRAS